MLQNEGRKNWEALGHACECAQFLLAIGHVLKGVVAMLTTPHFVLKAPCTFQGECANMDNLIAYH